jgi:hypothetical protein
MDRERLGVFLLSLASGRFQVEGHEGDGKRLPPGLHGEIRAEELHVVERAADGEAVLRFVAWFSVSASCSRTHSSIRRTRPGKVDGSPLEEDGLP